MTCVSFEIGFANKGISPRGVPRKHKPRRSIEIYIDVQPNQPHPKRKSDQRVPFTDRTNTLPIKKPKYDHDIHCQRSLVAGRSAEPWKNPSSSQSYEPSTSFNDLPAEILLEVFRLLPALSRGRTMLVCKQWHQILVQSHLMECIHMDEYVMLIRNSIRHSKRIHDFLASAKHPEISSEMRSVLVDWLIEVGDEFELQSETVFLTVNLVDRYLAVIQAPLSKNRFQLVGVGALLIASKLEEMTGTPINDLVYICDNAYSRSEILAMEVNILSVLGFDMTISSPRQYVSYLLQFIYEREPLMDDPLRNVLANLSYYLVDLSLYDLKLSITRPSLVAASAVSIARSTVNLSSWTLCLEQETFLSMKDLHSVGNKLFELFTTVQQQQKLNQQALYNKYSKPTFQQVAKVYLRRSSHP